MSQDSMAKTVVSEITTLPRMLENGTTRSPAKARRLHDQIGGMSFSEVLDFLAENETALHRIAVMVADYHTFRFRRKKDGRKAAFEPVVDWPGAEATWRKVLYLLNRFADQEGGQKLLPPSECGSILREFNSLLRQLKAAGKI